MGVGLIVIGIILSLIGTMFFIGGLFGNTGDLIIGLFFGIPGGILIQIGKSNIKKKEEKVTPTLNQKQVIQTSHTLPKDDEDRTEKHTWAWILVPFFFGLLGGIIAYFWIKEDNAREANQYLVVGIVMTVIWFITFWYIGVTSLEHAGISQSDLNKAVEQQIWNQQKQEQQSQQPIQPQQQDLDNKEKQIISQFDITYTKLINLCTTTQSVEALTICKSNLSDLKNECQDPNYSSMSVCSDPRINQFFSTVDNKIVSANQKQNTDLNAATLDMINLCSSIYSDPIECKSNMVQIQDDCKNQYVSACDDPRIDQIIKKQPYVEQQCQTIGDVISQSNCIVSNNLGRCMQATLPSDIQSCSVTAKKILDYCHNISSVGVEQICNDPRLQQVANMRQTTGQTTSIYNPMTSEQAIQQLGQITNPTSSASSSCPTQLTHDVIVTKNSLGNSLFNPQTLDLRGGDYVIFKSSDGKPHLLTSNNDGLRDWFLTNGALINNDQSIKLHVMIFGDSEKVLSVYDGYNPNISITLDVKPTPTECSK